VKLRLLESGKFPTGDKEVFALCDAALKQVEGELKPFLAGRKAINPVTSSASSARTVSPDPKTSMDVIDKVLSGMAS
jgi:hypothetical protein